MHSRRSFDLATLIEAAYVVDTSAAVWLKSLVEKTNANLRSGLGVFGMIYAVLKMAVCESPKARLQEHHRA